MLVNNGSLMPKYIFDKNGNLDHLLKSNQLILKNDFFTFTALSSKLHEISKWRH